MEHSNMLRVTSKKKASGNMQHRNIQLVSMQKPSQLAVDLKAQECETRDIQKVFEFFFQNYSIFWKYYNSQKNSQSTIIRRKTHQICPIPSKFQSTVLVKSICKYLSLTCDLKNYLVITVSVSAQQNINSASHTYDSKIQLFIKTFIP